MFYTGWTILIAFLLATGGIRMGERAQRMGAIAALVSARVLRQRQGRTRSG